MAKFWVYPSTFSSLEDAQPPREDTDENWHNLLNREHVQAAPPGTDPEDFKRNRSSAVCGCEFAPGATSRQEKAEAIIGVHSLILDVDNWSEKRPPFTWDELAAALDGFRFIAWTTFKSTEDIRRYRVVIPLATPVPPSKYKALCRAVNTDLGGAVSESTFTFGRLGYFKTAQSETVKKAYDYQIYGGDSRPRLAWEGLGLVDEVLEQKPTFQRPEKDPADWITPKEALENCKKYYARVGKGIGPGSRHETLLSASCTLWWEWAAPDDDFVREILTLVNSNFAEPHPPSEVDREVQAGWGRTRGPSAVGQESPFGCRREPLVRVTKTGLTDLVKRLKKRDATSHTSDVLKRMLKNESIGEPTEARHLLLNVLEAVAHHYPREAPDLLLDLLRQSIDAQRQRQPTGFPLPGDAELLAKIRQVQARVVRKFDEIDAERADDLKRRIRQAFADVGVDRDTPYTEEELNEFDKDGVDGRWVVQHGGVYYFFVDGKYLGPFDKDAANNMVGVYLAPASGRVKLTKFDHAGALQHKSCGDIIRDGKGRTVLKVEQSMIPGANALTSDGGGKLTISILPFRFDAMRVPEVETWLSKLAGNKIFELNRWLAALPDLKVPLSILALFTRTGNGKNLLVHGLSHLWSSTGPCRAEDYPDMLLNCPLVFADEGFPQTWHKGLSAGLRRKTSETSRPIKVLYENKFDLVGYMRLVLAANGSDVLKLPNRTKEDSEALATRFLIIENKSNDARLYLESLPKTKREEMAASLIAQHCLWLHETQAVADERFVVSSASSDLQRILATAGDDTSRVLAWVGHYILSERYSQPVVLFDTDGSLYVNTTELLGAWSTLDLQRNNIGTREIQRAVVEISDVRRAIRLDGKTKWYYRIGTALFVEALPAIGCDEDALHASLQVLHKRWKFTVYGNQAEADEAATQAAQGVQAPRQTAQPPVLPEFRPEVSA